MMRTLLGVCLLNLLVHMDRLAYAQGFELLVADKTANAVLRYDGQSGEFIDTFIPSASGLAEPVDVVVGPRGDLFVAQYGGTVLRFRMTDRAFLGAFYQNENGSIEELVGLRFGLGKLHLLGNDSGNLVLANAATGAELASYGTVGLARQFCLGPDGLLYVTHTSPSPGVRVYDPETTSLVREFGGSSLPTGITIGPDDLVYVAEYDSGAIKRYTRSGTYVGTFVSPGPNLERPASLRFGPDGHLYVTTGGVSGYPGDIRRFDGATGTFMGVVVANGVGGLSQPRGFTFRRKPDPPLEVLVVDRDAWAVKRYDAVSGEYIDDFIAGPLLEEARNVEIGLDGHVYITYFNFHKVRRFDGRTGRHLGVFFDGVADPNFHFEELVSTRFAWTAEGPRAYVLANDTFNVAICDGTTGEAIDSMGFYMGSYWIAYGHDMFVGPEGYLYIANELPDHNVQVWDPVTRALVRSKRLSALTTGICLGPDNRIYVTDWWGNRILRFDAETFGGTEVFVPGGTSLFRPTTVQFGPDGLLYVITGGISAIDGDIRCYNPITKQFQGIFIPNGSGGLDSPRGMVWRPTPRPGDCDGDFHVDADDYSELLSCLDGPGWLVDWPCDCFDLADRDGCVDLRDFATFQSLFLGDND